MNCLFCISSKFLSKLSKSDKDIYGIGILMNLKIIFITLIFFSISSFAEESWFCTQESSRVLGDTVQSCGIGKATDENDARVRAFENAQFEFYRLCKASDFCGDRKVSVDPKRTTCDKGSDGIYKCTRLLEFNLSTEKKERKVASVSSKNDGRVHYVEYEPNSTGGYVDSMESESISIARFIGNPNTPAKNIEGLAITRAMEVCYERGAQITFIMDGADTSTSTEANGKSTTYPSFNSYFSCGSKSSGIGIGMKALSPEDVKSFVKDLMGAVQVQEIAENSPNKGKVQIGDIIIKVNGNRITNKRQLIAELRYDSKDKISLNIIRDGSAKTIELKRVDTTEQNSKKYLTSKNLACKDPEISERPFCKVGSVRTVSSEH